MSRISNSALRRIPAPPLGQSQLFSTSAAREATWGFVGLGAMGTSIKSGLKTNLMLMSFLEGYPMAKNLRAKIPDTDTLVVCDTNAEATERFVEDFDGGTEISIADTPKEVAQRSVHYTCLFYLSPPFLLMTFCSIDDLS